MTTTQKLTAAEQRYVDLVRTIRANFGDEHGAIAFTLTGMAPNAKRHTKRLPAVAYYKGLLAGLGYDAAFKGYPECPYDRLEGQYSNHLRGDNNPSEAWRDGSRDGIRIREIILRPDRRPVPALQHREFKVLTPELQAQHELTEETFQKLVGAR